MRTLWVGLNAAVAGLRSGLLRNQRGTRRWYAAVDPLPETGEGRILLGFTCRVCNTRSHRTMSRQAYQRGVVLVECPGCQNRHLIADHLGWFEGGQTGTTVETILQARGEQIRRSWRSDEHGAILECLGEHQEEAQGQTDSKSLERGN